MTKLEDIHKYIGIEFVIWLVILCLLVFGIKINNYKKTKNFVTYQIFLPDVDGLIVGSPVKFMGVQVGYVSKIKIVSNEVYLKIVITDKNLKLPKGSVATVEFSGMGGSKSLEIYPPNEESIASGKIISIQNPVRLSESLSLLGDMFNKIDSIIVRVSYFAKETGVIDIKNGVDIDNIENNMNTADDLLKKINEGEKNEQHGNNKKLESN